MRLCLRTLRHHAHLQPLGHAHDAADHAVGPLVAANAADKAHVQLQRRHRHIHQHIERGVAVAKIVNQNGKARRIELSGQIQHLPRVLHIDAFRHLYPKDGGVHIVLFRKPRQLPADIRAVNIQPRHVGRNGHIGIARRFQLRQILKYPLPYILVQPVNKTIFFKNRDKLIGGNQPALGVVPAHQRLRRHRRVGRQAENRLEIHLKLALLQRLIHPGGHFLLPQQASAQLLVIKSNALVAAAGNGFLRNLCAVAKLRHRKRGIINFINAAAQMQRIFQMQPPHQFGAQSVEAGKLQFFRAAQQHKPVPAHAAHMNHAPHRRQLCRQIPQKLVARGPTEKIVEHLEAVHV